MNPICVCMTRSKIYDGEKCVETPTMNVQLKMDKPFVERLKEKTSQEFIELARNVEEAIDSELEPRNLPGYRGVSVIQFKNGSIIAEVAIQFHEGTEIQQSTKSVAQETLQSAIGNGKFASLNISEDTLIEVTLPQRTNDTQKDEGIPAYGIVLIILAIMVLGGGLILYIKRRHRNRQSSYNYHSRRSTQSKRTAENTATKSENSNDNNGFEMQTNQSRRSTQSKSTTEDTATKSENSNDNDGFEMT